MESPRFQGIAKDPGDRRSIFQVRASRYDELIPFFILSNGAIGACLGFLIGAFLAFLLRSGRKGLYWNALLGAIGFLGGLFASDLIPTAPNTVTRHVGKTIVRSTARHYQHPYFAAFVVAIALVALHQGVRALRAVRTSRSI